MTLWPPRSCHSDPVRHQLLREARMSPSLSHPPHENRSPVKAGPSPPAAQAPTRIGHIETCAGRPETGETPVERTSLTQVLSYPTSLLVLMEYALFFYYYFYFLPLQYCIGFAIHQYESATGIHVFPVLNPPPSSLTIPSLCIVPVHQPQASSIMHQTWTGNSFHI